MCSNLPMKRLIAWMGFTSVQQPMKRTTTSVSTVCTRQLEQPFWIAYCAWIISLVSASLWLHGGSERSVAQMMIVEADVMLNYLPSGHSNMAILLVSNAKACACWPGHTLSQSSCLLLYFYGIISPCFTLVGFFWWCWWCRPMCSIPCQLVCYLLTMTWYMEQRHDME